MMPHPEGGYYAPAFRSEKQLDLAIFTDNQRKGYRSAYSSIYFLLEEGNFSAWHRLMVDEIWHFYEGDPVKLHVIDRDGHYYQQLIGSTSDEICYQWLVKGGEWMAAITSGNHGYSLVGCTLTPGFDFEDFELATEASLRESYPPLTEEMQKLLYRK